MFGVKDTLACLEMGAVETLIVWENLDVQRYVFTHPSTGVQETKYLTKEQEGEAKHFKDPANNQDLDVTDKVRWRWGKRGFSVSRSVFAGAEGRSGRQPGRRGGRRETKGWRRPIPT